MPASREGENWETLGNIDRLRAFKDTIHYVLPKLLLVTTAFEMATFDKKAGATDSSNLKETSPVIPLGAAEGTTKVEMIKPENASDDIHQIFESIKTRHGHPLVSSYFRGLANWPNFLNKSWEQLSPLVSTAKFNARKIELIEQAELIVRKMGVPMVQELGLNQLQMAEVGAILVAFRLKFIPDMLLDATLIKAMLDGTELASSFRFTAKTAIQ